MTKPFHFVPQDKFPFTVPFEEFDGENTIIVAIPIENAIGRGADVNEIFPRILVSEILHIEFSIKSDATDKNLKYFRFLTIKLSNLPFEDKKIKLIQFKVTEYDGDNDSGRYQYKDVIDYNDLSVFAEYNGDRKKFKLKSGPKRKKQKESINEVEDNSITLLKPLDSCTIPPNK